MAEKTTPKETLAALDAAGFIAPGCHGLVASWIAEWEREDEPDDDDLIGGDELNW